MASAGNMCSGIIAERPKTDKPRKKLSFREPVVSGGEKPNRARRLSSPLQQASILNAMLSHSNVASTAINKPTAYCQGSCNSSDGSAIVVGNVNIVHTAADCDSSTSNKLHDGNHMHGYVLRNTGAIASCSANATTTSMTAYSPTSTLPMTTTSNVNEQEVCCTYFACFYFKCVCVC